MNLVLLIDDQPDTLSQHIGELRLRNFAVRVVDSIDAAYGFYTVQRPIIVGIVLDIIMPPSSSAVEEPGEDGMFTGVRIYRRILDVECVLVGNRAPPPVAILTNSMDPQLKAKIEQVRAEVLATAQHGGSGYECAYRVWRKTQSTPGVFARDFAHWLHECGRC